MPCILSSRELSISNLVLTPAYINQVLNRVETSPFIIGSTPFSLPFPVWRNKSPHDRDRWLKYRFNIYRNGLLKCLELQKINDNVNYTWLIFLSKGDRSKLRLEPIYVLPNGIKLMYIEIYEVQLADNKYYTSIVIPKVINQIIDNTHSLHDLQNTPILTLRVDSDDLISDHYLSTLLFALSISKATNCFMYFPFGTEFCHKENTVQPKIWPEPSFLSRLEYYNSDHISTVWEYSHDQIPLTEKLFSLLTTDPFWSIGVGTQNLLNNKLQSRFYNPICLSLDDVISELSLK